MHADASISVVYAGPLTKEHGLYEAIHAVQLARIRRVRLDLRLAGAGPLMHELRYFSAALDVTEQVSFQPLGAGDLGPLLDDADALLCLGEVRHVPHAVAQAVERGVRVIALRDSAIAAALKEGVEAILLPSARPSAICEAIVTLARSRRWRAPAHPARVSG